MQGTGKRDFWRVKPTPLLATCTITERLYGESQNSVLCLLSLLSLLPLLPREEGRPEKNLKCPAFSASAAPAAPAANGSALVDFLSAILMLRC